MASTTLSELLRLPVEERAELAIAPWDRLGDLERETELALTPEQEEELDRRWREYLSDPGSSVSWEALRKRLGAPGHAAAE